MEIESKKEGSSLTSAEFNQIPDELENVISKAGLTPTKSSLTQVSQSISQMVGDASFYSTSGTANDIILSAVSPRLAPAKLTNGMMVRFQALFDNTDITTVNVANLGAKNVTINGEQISGNTLKAGSTYIMTYVANLDSFEVFVSSGANIDLSNLSTNGQSIIDNKVSKSGDTMSGSLTFPNANSLPMQFNFSGLTDSTTTPSTTGYYGVQFNDAKGVRVGKVETSWKTDGTTMFGINAHRVVNGTPKFCQIACSVDASGNLVTSAPTPPATDNSTQIATTSWVHINKATITSWAFPSTKYTDLTLNASGSSYTAPANGWFCIDKKATAGGQYFYFKNTTAGGLEVEYVANNSSSYAKIFLPAKKGDKVKVEYNLGGATSLFRFVYAEGSK